eukprot:482828-Pyramimonas_sp.AAC.1
MPTTSFYTLVGCRPLAVLLVPLSDEPLGERDCSIAGAFASPLETYSHIPRFRRSVRAFGDRCDAFGDRCVHARARGRFR